MLTRFCIHFFTTKSHHVMRKMITVRLLAALLMTPLLISCQEHRAQPTSGKVMKVFTARVVDENGTTVYTRGATGNIRPGYGTFRLDMSDPNNVVLRDFDANTFVGQWLVPNNTQLTLVNLTPQPSGTGGTIDFVINSVTDTELVLTRTSVSQKTGGLIVKYTLTTP